MHEDNQAIPEGDQQMSVDTRRLAAAQRTAARKTSGAQPPRRRWLRLASWLLIVPTLSLFSFSVVAGAAGFGSEPDYSSAAQQLPQDKPMVVITSGSLKEICSVGPRQLAVISSRWRTGRISISVGGRPLDVVTVSGASESDLRGALGGPGLSCRLVQVARIFFLPFDPHGS